MIAFIDEHRSVFGVEPICRLLQIAPSTYYAHVTQRDDPTKASVRSRRDAELSAEIRRVFQANFEVYGCSEMAQFVRSQLAWWHTAVVRV